MNTMESEQFFLPYLNVMEILVAEEVKRQLKHLSPKLVKYLNTGQVIAYALNRLPALYATSLEGWQRQKQRARKEFAQQIFMSVRQGLAAVQRDPLKVSTPLVYSGDTKSEADNR